MGLYVDIMAFSKIPDSDISKAKLSQYKDKIVTYETFGTSESGLKHGALYNVVPNSKWTIIYCHDNDEDLASIAKDVIALSNGLGASVLAWEYCGYSISDSWPPGEGLLLEGIRGALKYITDAGIPSKSVVLMGKGYGCYPCLRLAKAEGQKIAGVVLNSPATSFLRANVASTAAWLLSLTDMLVTTDLAKEVAAPSFVIHGKLNDKIEEWHGREIHSILPNAAEPWFPEGKGHYDIFSSDLVVHLKPFFSGLTPVEREPAPPAAAAVSEPALPPPESEPEIPPPESEPEVPPPESSDPATE